MTSRTKSIRNQRNRSRNQRRQKMHLRTLGQGLQVSAIGYGCMGLSQSYLPVPTRDEGIWLLRAAVDREYPISKEGHRISDGV